MNDFRRAVCKQLHWFCQWGKKKDKIILKQHRGWTREWLIIKVNLYKIWKESSLNTLTWTSGNQGSSSFFSTDFCANLRDHTAFCTISLHLSTLRMNISKIVSYSGTTEGIKCRRTEKVFSTGRKIRSTKHYHAQILSSVIFSELKIIWAGNFKSRRDIWERNVNWASNHTVLLKAYSLSSSLDSVSECRCFQRLNLSFLSSVNGLERQLNLLLKETLYISILFCLYSANWALLLTNN